MVTNYINDLITSPAAIVGLVASITVLVSMCFNTRTRIGELLMRSLNAIGSIISVIYGLMLGPDGFGMLILNAPLVFINSYYFIRSLIKNTCSDKVD